MKIIKIKNCEECVYSYENIWLAFSKTLICGEDRVTAEKPKIEDRTIKSKKIPVWCPLENLK